MAEKHHVLIVASPRARTGKTLLARLLAEHLTLIGQPRVLFDTDAVDPRLSTYFPSEAKVVDLERTKDQMLLFDRLSEEPPVSQVIDLTHRSYTRFFRLMTETDYVGEAKARKIEPVILYVPDAAGGTYAEGNLLRESFRKAGFIVVRNEMFGAPDREAQHSPAVAATLAHRPTIVLPQLDPFLLSALEDVRLSLSDFMRHASQRQTFGAPSPGRMSLAYLSLEARQGLTHWLTRVFNEIRRALRDTDLQAEIIAHDQFGT